ncbi:fungal transcriptional regulatory protein [Penicillium chermesinum]|uniref:Fungal transcriptional regulatory protein n=1 Tax=Penicillium chermesinum TaxID=63820 RepID=A0A9W9N843_9EURO|nr:fungal transcriptional regulatory protein [Penicillium chermesinum]KAJ5215008.1 fungal transcriptional regulatory protein [Penicillium chermesinum]
MRCRIENGKICRRCKRAGLPCVFVPRANAARGWTSSELESLKAPSLSPNTMFDILRRVKTIEEYIGIENEQAAGTTAEDFESSSARPEELEDDQTLEPLWRATAQLEASAPTRSRGSLWHRNMIKHLFQT